MHKSAILFLSLLLPMLVAAAGPFPITIATNTLYQNTNTSALQIYSVTHSAPLSGYLGTAPANMMQVIGETGGSVTISSIVYSIAGYNMSATMTVEPAEYYKFNFTDATFYGQWLPLGNTSSGSGNTSGTYLVNVHSASASQYSSTAQILFAIGVLLSVFMLLLVFRVLKLATGIIGGIEGFAVGFIAALFIIYALQFTSVVQIQPYTINAFNSILSVHAQSASTKALASQTIFSVVGYSFALVDFFFGFIYLFLAMLVYRSERVRRRYS